MIGLIIYPFYIYINVLKKTENQHYIHIEFHNDYLIYDCLYFNKKTIPYELIDYYIRKKIIFLSIPLKVRIYVPTISDIDIDDFLYEKS